MKDQAKKDRLLQELATLDYRMKSPKYSGKEKCHAYRKFNKVMQQLADLPL